MTFIIEIILVLGFSAASFYVGYRYSIDFQAQEAPFVPEEEVDLESGNKKRANKQKQVEYSSKQRELDSLLQQLREQKQKEKKYQAEIQVLQTKQNQGQKKVLSEKEFNSLLDE